MSRVSQAPDMWREGPYLVVRRGATLPRRCVICGSREVDLCPYDVRLPHRWRFNESEYQFARRVVLAVLFSPSVRIEAWFCRAHHVRERNYRLAAYAVWILAVGLVATGVFILRNQPATGLVAV